MPQHRGDGAGSGADGRCGRDAIHSAQEEGRELGIHGRREDLGVLAALGGVWSGGTEAGRAGARAQVRSSGRGEAEAGQGPPRQGGAGRAARRGAPGVRNTCRWQRPWARRRPGRAGSRLGADSAPGGEGRASGREGGRGRGGRPGAARVE
jgi:hypothetical protein